MRLVDVLVTEQVKEHVVVVDGHDGVVYCSVLELLGGLLGDHDTVLEGLSLVCQEHRFQVDPVPQIEVVVVHAVAEEQVALVELGLTAVIHEVVLVPVAFSEACDALVVLDVDGAVLELEEHVLLERGDHDLGGQFALLPDGDIAHSTGVLAHLVLKAGEN